MGSRPRQLAANRERTPGRRSTSPIHPPYAARAVRTRSEQAAEQRERARRAGEGEHRRPQKRTVDPVDQPATAPQAEERRRHEDEAEIEGRGLDASRQGDASEREDDADRER